MEPNLVIYHCHSSLSNLTAGTSADCVTPYELYIDRAVELGMTAISISEHGNMAHWLKKQEYAREKGIKYIHGMESYITLTADPDKTKRDNFHLGLYAKNWEGMQELLKLSSNSFSGRNAKVEPDDKHFYYNPRITMEELMATSDNIIITTACLGSPLWKLYKQANVIPSSLEESYGKKLAQKNLDSFIEFLAKNKHRTFLEIQYHSHPEQIEYNQVLFNISKEYDIPLIAGSDTHSLDERYAEVRKVFLKSKGANYGDEDDFDLTFPSYNEMVDRFEKQWLFPSNIIEEAIQNTVVFANMIEEFDVDRSNKYPRLHDQPEKTFKKLINEGFKKRGLDKLPKAEKEIYLNRIHEEYETYVKTDTIDYMLLQKDVTDWAHDQKIRTGDGRGSVTGSLIAYLLEIAEMDSIKHNLNFFRFINPHRVSLADIDTDIQSNRRHEVIDYLASRDDIYFSEIITFNTLKLKGSIKELGRGMGMDKDLLNEIAGMAEDPELQPKLREIYPDLFRYADIMVGCIVSMGSHPSGFLVSPVPLDENIGLLWTKDSAHPVSQLNMKEVDSLNYVKLDLLGLDNIWLIADTCELAGIPYAQPHNTDLNDEKVWESFSKDTLGVFQMEGDMATKLLAQLFDKNTIAKIKEEAGEVNYLSLLSMANGAIRPSGASYRDALSRGEFKDNGHEVLNDFLKDTLGYMVFQEQIMRWLVEFCGYSESESDTVRRAIGKKTGTEQLLPKIKKGFMNTMVEKHSVAIEEAEKLSESFLQIILDASDYSFSLNHSEAYSVLGYICAWLRCYYPREFITTMLNIQSTKSSDLDKTPAVMQWAKAHNIKVERITFGKSKGGYTLDKKTGNIYKGVASVSYLNNTVANELYDIALQINEHIDDISFVELMYILREQSSIQSDQLEILIKLRYFDMFGDPNTLLALKYQFYEGKFKYTKNVSDKTKDLKLMKLLQAEKIIRAKDIPKTSIEETLCFELDKLGYISTTYTEVPDNLYFVMEINTRYTPKLTLYRLSDGEEFKVKMRKNKFFIDVIDDYGDIETTIQSVYQYDTIKVTGVSEKEGVFKNNQTNEWIKTGKYEDWIEAHKVIRKSSLRKAVF